MPEIIESHKAWATSEQARLPIGFHPFDSRSGGIAPGELMLFMARPSVGKTVWALSVIARNRLVPTVLFSLEMDARMIIQRLAAITYGVPTHAIETEVKVHGTSKHMEALARDFPCLWIEDDPQTSLKDIRGIILDINDTSGYECRLAIVDHLELVKGGRSLEAQGNVAAISYGLKNIARQTLVSMITLQQVARGQKNSGDQPLSLVSGRFGGEDAADYVLGAYRPALRKGISKDEYLTLKEHFYLQYLKTRSGGEIAPAGALYQMNESMQLLAWDSDAKGTNQPH